jgi:ribonuclease R
VNHWIVAEGDVPEDLATLCDRASERQKAAEKCEREYEQFLEEVGLDPNAVNNRGLEVVEDTE